MSEQRRKDSHRNRTFTRGKSLGVTPDTRLGCGLVAFGALRGPRSVGLRTPHDRTIGLADHPNRRGDADELGLNNISESVPIELQGNRSR